MIKAWGSILFVIAFLISGVGMYSIASVVNADSFSIQATGNSIFVSYEGKVVSYDKKKLSLDIPIEGVKTFIIDERTRIEDQRIPLKVGVLVEVDVKGDVASKIETEQFIEGEGKIIEYTKSSVTIERNGKSKTFQKASNFYVDKDGYQGSLVDLLAEYKLNDQFEIVELDIED